MRMTRSNRFLFVAAVVVQQQLWQLVLSSTTFVPDVNNADDMACLKMQLWSNNDCSNDPDNEVTTTVPTVSTDDCGT
jgi:hypothetical protein